MHKGERIHISFTTFLLLAWYGLGSGGCLAPMLVVKFTNRPCCQNRGFAYSASCFGGMRAGVTSILHKCKALSAALCQRTVRACLLSCFAQSRRVGLTPQVTAPAPVKGVELLVYLLAAAWAANWQSCSPCVAVCPDSRWRSVAGMSPCSGPGQFPP